MCSMTPLFDEVMMSDYNKLLMRDEWKAKRAEILARDHHRCLRRRREDRLEVHHCKYDSGRKPWDYPNYALITLCFDCHQKIHEKKRPYVLSRNGGRIRNLPACKRCDGKGYIVKYQHIERGVCFKCWGSGIAFDDIIDPSEQTAAMRQKRASVTFDLEDSEPQSKYLRKWKTGKSG